MSTDIVDAEFTSKAIARTNGSEFMPSMSINQAVSRYNSVLEFTKEIMKDGKDFGTIPGSAKACLLKPGAEKLCSFFGLTPRFVIVEKDEDWTGARHGGEQFFYYHYRAQLWRNEYLLGEAEGSCNSMESKYRFRWVQEDQVPPEFDKAKLKRRGGKQSEFAFAIDKGETTGQYGKPAAYWQAYRDAISNGTAQKIKRKTKTNKEMDGWEIDATLFRIPNQDIADQVNSIQKMGQKRAMVAAVLIVCNASEYYTQDIEDMDYVETEHVAPAKPESPKQDTEKTKQELEKNREINVRKLRESPDVDTLRKRYVYLGTLGHGAEADARYELAFRDRMLELDPQPAPMEREPGIEPDDPLDIVDDSLND